MEGRSCGSALFKLVIHRRRNVEKVETQFTQDGPLSLDPPGLTVDVGAFWEV